MTAEEIRAIIQRIDGIWPPRTAPTHDERAEWVRFLQPLDGAATMRAIDEMRESSRFRPSMADLKTAYYEAAALPGEDALLLPSGGVQETLTQGDVYGAIREDWVYCWRCDMAISLKDQEETAVYDSRRGFAHRHCPRPGSAPSIPTRERLERDEYFRRNMLSKT